jgi:hypothetical protein
MGRDHAEAKEGTMLAHDATVEALAAGEATADETPDEGSLLRGLIGRAYPDIVPELVQGETLAEMLASIPAAQAAYARIVEVARAGAEHHNGRAGQLAVPAGAAVRSAGTSVEGLSAMAKIRAGLAHGGR